MWKEAGLKGNIEKDSASLSEQFISAFFKKQNYDVSSRIYSFNKHLYIHIFYIYIYIYTGCPKKNWD